MSMPWYDGVVFSSPFLTPNHKYPFSIKNLLQKIRSSTDHLHKKLFIVLDGVNPSPDQQINKKKAREIIELVDKVIIANYDCPRSN